MDQPVSAALQVEDHHAALRLAAAIQVAAGHPGQVLSGRRPGRAAQPVILRRGLQAVIRRGKGCRAGIPVVEPRPAGRVVGNGAAIRRERRQPNRRGGPIQQPIVTAIQVDGCHVAGHILVANRAGQENDHIWAAGPKLGAAFLAIGRVGQVAHFPAGQIHQPQVRPIPPRNHPLAIRRERRPRGKLARQHLRVQAGSQRKRLPIRPQPEELVAQAVHQAGIRGRGACLRRLRGGGAGRGDGGGSGGGLALSSGLCCLGLSCRSDLQHGCRGGLNAHFQRNTGRQQGRSKQQAGEQKNCGFTFNVHLSLQKK